MSIKKFNEEFTNETTSTILKQPPQDPAVKFDIHLKNAEKFLADIQAGINELKKQRKTSDQTGWKYIADMYEVADQLNSVKNFINNTEEDYNA